MDAVRGGQSFTVTRDGHQIGELIPLRRRRRFVPRSEFAAMSRTASDLSLEVFRVGQKTTPDGTIWRCMYDHLGRRTSKLRLADDGETVVEQTHFTWDGTTLVEQTTTAAGGIHPVTLTWEHDGLHPLTQTERITDATSQHGIDQRFFAIVTDLVGTPTELVDTSGAPAWRARTTLWGTTSWPTTASAYTPLRFPGQYHDPETGFHYNLLRHYDPTTAATSPPTPSASTPPPTPTPTSTTPTPGPTRWVWRPMIRYGSKPDSSCPAPII